MKLSIILLILALVASLFAQQAGPTVFYVSNDPSQQTSPAYSSLRGGKLIFLKVTGHDPMATGNLVYVGTFPCVIPSDGVTDTFISCETSDSWSTTGISSLPVTLISNSIPFTTSWPNVVSYSNSYTPSLNEMFPTSGFANLNVYFYGVHRISDLGDGRFMGDVVKLKLGNDLCSRFDVVQAAIDGNSNQYIQCIESNLQVAGKYNVSEQVTPGYANHAPALRRASLVNEYYEFTALPVVASISPVNGNQGGQYLTITGTGFAGQNENNTVTIDGNPCVVNSSSENQIQCTVAPRNLTLSSLLPATNSSAQVNGYFAGSGLNYARYSVPSNANPTVFASAVRAQNSTYLGAPLEIGFRGELKEGDVYGSYYGQAWNGYFTAPTTGTYVFRGTADDQFSFYIGSTHGSTDLPAAPLISSTKNQPYWNNFYIDDSPLAEANVSLTAGLSYYIEAYHVNNAGGGYFKIDVDVPNSDTTLPFQAYEVDKIILNSTVQPETVTYTMLGGSTGYINLRLVRTDPSSGSITYNVNTTVAYACSAATFQNALNNFDSFSPYQISVVRTIYDSTGAVTNDTTVASRIEYVVSIFLLRNTSYSAEDFIKTYTNYTGTFTKTLGLTHSPLISGTFTLSIGGVSFPNISYNAGAGTIQASINTINGYEQVLVDQVSQYGAGISNTWIIRYLGVNNAIPNVTVNGAGLSGGMTSPTINVIVRRPYSSSITFDPVDYRFLNTYSAQPNVQVSTNGIPAICSGNCGYAFKDVFNISSLSLNGSTISLALITSPSNLTINLTSIGIWVQNLPCPIDASATSITALTCTLPTNADLTPILIAGDVIPTVYVNPIGIAGLATGVNPIHVPLVVNQLTKTSGGNNGGYYNMILGSGFPLDKSKVSVTICNISATIISSSNEKISFYMPACPSIINSTVIVAVGALTDQSQIFQYTDGAVSAPTIASISPTTQNPAIKGILHITGSGFGTNQSAVQVFLSNATGKIYQLNVLSVNDTDVTAGLSGGLAGPFTVQVTLPDFSGNNIADAGVDQFQYLCSITSVSPSTGSYNGGTLLTITGTNFSPAYSDTLVYIGDTLNWFCNIVTITATQITCRTPPISKDYTAGASQRVVISTKLYLFNTCPSNNCNFTYLDATSSPMLSTISLSKANAVTLTLTGTGFISNTTCSVSIISAANSSIVYSVPGINCTNNSTKFTVPATVPSANYLVKVNN
jgi:hypothetical protein